VVEVVASPKLQDVSDARLHPCPSKPSKLDLARVHAHPPQRRCRYNYYHLPPSREFYFHHYNFDCGLPQVGDATVQRMKANDNLCALT
jgi:hypothetical protein